MTVLSLMPQDIAEIEKLGFSWTEDSSYDLSQLSDDRRIQVREAKEYTPKETVDQYAVQMGESKFPPIVVTRDGWIIDGNTRIASALQRKNKFFPAYVLDVDYMGPKTTEQQKNELYALAVTLNNKSGNRLSPRSNREGVTKLLALNYKPEEIARRLGVQATKITQIRREVDAAAKLQRVGLDLTDSDAVVQGASLRALGSKDVLALNDHPYRSLAQLAGAAGLNAKEIAAAAKAAKDTGSDVAQVKLLEEMREEMAERIRTRELTGVGKPPMARQLRQHLGFITKFADGGEKEGRVNELLETDPNVIDKHVETLRAAIGVLQATIDLQLS